MPMGIVPGVRLRPATVPFSVEFCLRFFGLVAVFSVFTNFMAKVFFRLLDFVLASAAAIVGEPLGRSRDHQRRAKHEGEYRSSEFQTVHLRPPQNHNPCSTFSDWID